MRGEVTRNICNYMNSHSFKKFNIYHVSAIRKSINLELKDRREKNISINSKSTNGKWQIYKRTAEIANQYISNIKLLPEDIRLFKTCWRMEYSNRTGKCSWGIPSARYKLGYDPVTGYEVRT